MKARLISFSNQLTYFGQSEQSADFICDYIKKTQGIIKVSFENVQDILPTHFDPLNDEFDIEIILTYKPKIITKQFTFK